MYNTTSYISLINSYEHQKPLNIDYNYFSEQQKLHNDINIESKRGDLPPFWENVSKLIEVSPIGWAGAIIDIGNDLLFESTYMTISEYEDAKNILNDIDAILDHEKLTVSQLTELIENLDMLKEIGYFDHRFSSGRIDYEDIKKSIANEIFGNYGPQQNINYFSATKTSNYFATKNGAYISIENSQKNKSLIDQINNISSNSNGSDTVYAGEKK